MACGDPGGTKCAETRTASTAGVMALSESFFEPLVASDQKASLASPTHPRISRAGSPPEFHTVVAPQRHFKVQISGTCGCALIWKSGLCRRNEEKALGLPGWANDEPSSRRQKIRHAGDRPHEDR